MIVRPQQHWLRRIFVWHGSVLSKISSRLLLNFLFSIAVIFMLPWYTHLGIKFTLAPFSILGVAIAIFLGFRNNAGYARYVEARKLWGQLMIASRSLLREVKTTLPDSASVREFARLQIAFAHCLRMTLRKQPHMTPFISVLISYTFISLDCLAEELEDPFGTENNDLPLDAICNAIEIDLLQMNDEAEIPAKILPDRHYQLT
ncbi:bestrophin family protein [Escherichia coli]|uniref:bestrophin family protein n=1 Tax=Escherichia coli TaxID=562 RepID=UPI000CFB0DCF|nr:bestrophin family ion channel [Escherichia coli]